MANKHQKTEKKHIEQTTAPDPQIELTDEQLEQVTGGGVIWDGVTSPTPWPPGPTATLVGPEI